MGNGLDANTTDTEHIDAAIAESEGEHVQNGVLLDAREAPAELREKHFATRRVTIDIGTVTTRMMIADCWPAASATAGSSADADSAPAVDVLYKTAVITELGEGLVQSGVLKPEAIARVAAAVDGFVQTMREFGLDLAGNSDERPFAIAMATSAARDASNSGELVSALAARNIPLKVISGDIEASLSFAGAVSDFAGEGILVNDIGGGSTELIFGDSPQGGVPAIRKAHSFNVGCRRVTDMFLHDDPPTEAELAQARSWIESQIEGFFAGDDAVKVRKLIGVAGTATSLVSMHDQMREYDSGKVHGRTMRRADVDAALERLAGMTLEQRRNVVGLEPKRAGVIVAGMLILQTLMQLSGTDELVVSESDNLKGLMLNWPF